jgi:hypothetical protein
VKYREVFDDELLPFLRHIKEHLMQSLIRNNKYSEALKRKILLQYFHQGVSVLKIMKNLSGVKPSRRLIYYWLQENRSIMGIEGTKKRLRKRKEAEPDPAFESKDAELLYYRKYLQIDKIEGDVKKKLNRSYLMSLKKS